MESDAVVGPPRERLAPGTARTTAEQFERIVGALTEGALCFPYPFDLRASSALAGNTEQGLRALSGFALAIRAARPAFRIQVVEVLPGPGGGSIEREIVGTEIADMRLALPLIEQAAMDIESVNPGTDRE